MKLETLILAPHQIQDKNCAAHCCVENGDDVVHNINRKLDGNDKDIKEAYNISDFSTQNWTVAQSTLSCWRRLKFWLINHHFQLVAKNSNIVQRCKKRKKRKKNTVSIQEVLEPSVGNDEVPLIPGQFCVHTGDEAGSERWRKS